MSKEDILEAIANMSVMEVVEAETPPGSERLPALIQFGGQTPLNLATTLETRDVALPGISVDAIDRAEDRTRFATMIETLGIPQPRGGIATSLDEALAMVAEYAQERARWSSVSREDIAQATRRSYDGTPVGLYREGDSVYPIIVRSVESDRQRMAAEMDLVQVQPSFGLKKVPLGQVTDDIQVQWEDPIIVRFQRRRQAAVQASPHGVTFPQLRAEVKEEIEAIELPPGYSLFWDGEYASTRTAQLSLVPGMVPAVVIMAVIIVALFNALRPALIIALAIPFALIGITAILLPTQTPFGFMALLGAMSLAGLMIKNSIVLMDEINANLAAGKSPYDATVEAGLSRVRPVILGAATTVLGVAPLLQDAFWVSMSMTIMAGLAFGTGTHATTSLCLEWLDGLELRDASILDYGCGSGILALAALRLGDRKSVV